MKLLEFAQVSKQYKLGETTVPVLRNIDLTVEEGEFIAISGPSGSGKSTLCNLMGLLDRPSSGSIRFSGQEVADLSDDESSELRNTSIGFVFQSFNLISVLSAFENVMLPLQIMSKVGDEAAALAHAWLCKVGLGEYASRRPHKLSGGQQQRVALARALVTAPLLVIADEPTANLDSRTAIDVLELMRELNQNTGKTFVFATHDQRLLNTVDRIVVLRDGVVAEDRRL